MSIRRGKAASPEGLMQGQDVVVLKCCPDCGGRGWYLINPFATGGSNGAGGIGNLTQCLTCLDSKAYWDQHGRLPPEIIAELTAEVLAEIETTGGGSD